MLIQNEVKTTRPAAKQFVGALPAWWPFPANDGAGATASRPGARVSDSLSHDSEIFMSGQWQPFGE